MDAGQPDASGKKKIESIVTSLYPRGSETPATFQADLCTLTFNFYAMVLTDGFRWSDLIYSYSKKHQYTRFKYADLFYYKYATPEKSAEAFGAKRKYQVT